MPRNTPVPCRPIHGIGRNRPSATGRLARLAVLLGLGVLAVTPGLQPLPALAKLNPAPGKDGAPPSPESEAETDAKNDALDDMVEPLPGDPQGVPRFPRVDLCRCPLSNWLTPGSGRPVAEALDVPGVRSDLEGELEDFVHHMLLIETAGSDLAVDRPRVGIRCEQCAMTYTECLVQGNDVEFCKSRYLNCPQEPVSKLSITVPATQRVLGLPVARGTVTISASASYRAGSARNPDFPEWCVKVHDHEIRGFDVTFIRDRIETVIGSMRCLPASAPTAAR